MLILLIIQLTPFTADRVEIVREDGQSVYYLFGHVDITGDSLAIQCQQARLFADADRVELLDSVWIRDPGGEIRAARAEYRFGERLAFLSGGVTLIDSNRTISAESLTYDGGRRRIKMYRTVLIHDPGNNLDAYGQQGWFDLAAETGALSGGPRLEVQRRDKTPMIINARDFFLDAGNNLFYGYDSVTALIDSITILADTFKYGLKSEDGTMVQPRITEKENLLRGSSGTFQIRQQLVHRFSVADGQAVYHTAEGSTNVVTGMSITILFKNGQASTIFVNGDPRGHIVNPRKEKNAEN